MESLGTDSLKSEIQKNHQKSKRLKRKITAPIPKAAEKNLEIQKVINEVDL